MFRLQTAAALALALSSPAVAQNGASHEHRIEGVEAAVATARTMRAVQDATILAQRQYLGMTGGVVTDGFQGAIAFPGGEAGVWEAVIVGSENGAPDAPLVSLADYRIADGAIVAESIHYAGNQPYLDGPKLAMAAARHIAPRAVIAASDLTFCADENLGARGVALVTLVLPPRADGTFDAYVLNGPIEEGAIPLGKHYRVPFDSFGLAGEPLLLNDTCEVATWSAEDPDLARQVFSTRFDGGDRPNEIHAFLSSLMPISMAIVTGDTVWPLADGWIGEPVSSP